MAKLGDMVCTTPMFRAVKEKYPKAKLYVVGNSINKEILLGNNDVDEYIVWNKNNFWELVKRLRGGKIDFACQTGPIFDFLAMFYLAGIPSIATPKIENGYCPWETKAYKLLRRFATLIPHRMGSYAPREYLRLLEPIDIYTDNTTKYLAFSKEAGKRVEDIFIENGVGKEEFLFCISPAAGNKIKQWPAGRFAKVADHIYGKYETKIFIIGAKNDRTEVLEMVYNLNKETKVINLLDKLSLEELKALMSRMNMFVSVDTGPIYIAEAFGIPTVDITGPIDENEQPPISKLNRIVNIKNRKKPELYVMNARVYDEAEARRQTEEITMEMVTDEIDDLYGHIKKNDKKIN
jgi:ADP-heptose:LPS heptosyltransferase